MIRRTAQEQDPGNGGYSNYRGGGYHSDSTQTAANAETATRLATPREINGVEFDGTSSITISAEASDVHPWAKAETKPDYTAGEVGALDAVSSSSPLSGDGTSGAPLTMAAATDAVPGYMTASDHALLTGKANAANPILTGAITHGTRSLKAIIRKTGLADNTATGVATITTTNETGSTDGGCYTCKIKAQITHGAASGNATQAVVYGEYAFCRAMASSGAGVNSAVSVIAQTASAAITGATRDIGTITVTVVETTEFVQTITFQIDLTGSSVTTAIVDAEIEVLYTGFITPPAIASA